MLPSEKYFNGAPATSWTTCTISGSRRIFPRPENATIAAKMSVMSRYTVFTLFVSVLLVHASRVLIVPEPCEFRMPEMI
jgi:hypothetical protein